MLNADALERTMDRIPDTWPAPVQVWLSQRYGTAMGVERLGGMSVAQVHRVRFAEQSVIVKASPRPFESRFYERVAEPLRRAGVPIPNLEWSAHLAELHWLILEDIPEPLPVPSPDHWEPDPRVVTVLARLHQATRDWSPDLPDHAAYRWDEAATENALRCFPPEVAADLGPLLRALQQETARVHEPRCWISGDPSPPNWGLRADRSVVLFDWELFRPGLPASDLAPSVPGLGTIDMMHRAAASYLEAWQRSGETLPWTTDDLARDIALSKMATVVLMLQEHLHQQHHGDGSRIPDELVAGLVAHVPAWLQTLSF